MKPQYSLHNYQKSSVEWMKNVRHNPVGSGGVLFMEMGLGKSITTLEYLHQTNIRRKTDLVNSMVHFPQDITNLFNTFTYGIKKHEPSLIICSKTLINEWINQIDKFYEEKPKYYILHNNFNKIKDVTVKELQQYDIIFTTYHMVARGNKLTNFSQRYIYKDGQEFFSRYVIAENDNQYLRGHNYLGNELRGISCIYGLVWDNVICDECQTLTNWRTTFFKSIYSLASKYKFGLSGTPIKNNKNELIALLKYLKVHGFNVMKDWAKIELQQEVFSLFRKVDYNDAGIVLPIENHFEIPILMNRNQGEIYAKYVEELWELYRGQLERDNVKSAAIMGLFIRLRQICLDPYLLTLKRKSNDQYETVMQERSSELTFNNEKLTRVLNIIQNREDLGEKVIIFSAFTSYLKLLSEHLTSIGKNNTFIESKNSIRTRQLKINNWKTSEDNNILIMNYGIGAEGLNLVEANNIIILDTWWNFSLEAQAIARVKRIGQTREVNVYRLLMKNTIESIILEKSQLKMNLFQKLKNKEKIQTKILSQANILALLNSLKQEMNLV